MEWKSGWEKVGKAGSQILQAVVRSLDIIVKSNGKTRTPELFIVVIVLNTAFY